MKYCNNCKNQVEPVKEINWFLMILLSICSAGTWLIVYIFYFLVLKKPRCPICNSKALASEDSVIMLGRNNLPAKGNYYERIEPRVNDKLVDLNKNIKTVTESIGKSVGSSAKYTGGVVISIFGAIFTLGLLIAMIDGGIKLSMVVGLIGLGIIPLVLGLRIVENCKKAIKENKDEKIEKIILNLASEKNMTLTVVDVAKNTELTLKEAETELQSIVKNGYAISFLNDEGIIEYKFK